MPFISKLTVTAVFFLFFFCFVFTDNRDTLITRSHHGVLPVGSSYTEAVSFLVPHKIHGRYFFIVVTDVFDNVYEHVLENDNTNQTMVKLE